MTDRRSAAQLWAALLIVYLVWGSTYLAIRVVVQGGLPPLLGMGIRFLLAAPLLAAFVALRGGLGRLRITRRELLASAAVGTLLVAMGNGMVAVAEQTVPSGLAALLIASVPLLMVVLRLTRRDMPRPLVWLGVIIGFIGVAFLGLQGGGMADVERWGVLLTLFAATCWGIGSFYSRSWGVPTDSLVATVYEMALGGIVAVAIGLARGERLPLQLGVLPASTWVAFGYLVVVGSMVAYTAYAWLLQNAPISLTATYAYVNPAVAVLLGAVILSEPVTGVVLIGGGLAILGVALVVTAEPPRTAAPKPAVTPARSRRPRFRPAPSHTPLPSANQSALPKTVSRTSRSPSSRGRPSLNVGSLNGSDARHHRGADKPSNTFHRCLARTRNGTCSSVCEGPQLDEVRMHGQVAVGWSAFRCRIRGRVGGHTPTTSPKTGL